MTAGGGRRTGRVHSGERTLPWRAGAPWARRALAFALGMTLLAPLAGHAATLVVTGQQALGAGTGAVSPCDTAFGHGYTTLSGYVTSVEVTGIADPACEGGQLALTLTNASGASLAAGGPVTIPTDADTVDNTVSVAVSPAADADFVTGIRISVAGA